MSKKNKKPSLQSSLIITQSNKLVESRYNLPLGEQRLILTMISRIQPDDDDFKPYCISVRELAEFLSVDKNSIYRECKKTTENLLSRVLSIQEPDGLLQTNWVSSAKYIDKTGMINLTFDPSLKPYLLQLKSNFTSCKLEMLLSFKSQYTMRIYMLVKQYEKLKEREIDLEQLKEILGILKNQYQDYKNFKSRVLQATQKELKEKADLYFEFQEIKYGRKVGAIRFQIFSQKLPNALISSEQTSLFDTLPLTTDIDSVLNSVINPPKSSPSDELLSLIPEPHRSKKTVLSAISEYLKKHGFDYVKRNILYSNAKSGKSYAGFFANALKEDWGYDWQLDQQHNEAVPQSSVNEPSVLETKVLEVWERQGFSSEKDYAQFMFNKQMAEYAKHTNTANSKEDVVIQHANNQSHPVFERFLALPVEQQNQLRDQFIKITDSIVRAKIKSSMQKGEAFYASPLVSNNFKVFLKQHHCVDVV